MRNHNCLRGAAVQNNVPSSLDSCLSPDDEGLRHCGSAITQPTFVPPDQTAALVVQSRRRGFVTPVPTHTDAQGLGRWCAARGRCPRRRLFQILPGFDVLGHRNLFFSSSFHNILVGFWTRSCLCCKHQSNNRPQFSVFFNAATTDSVRFFFFIHSYLCTSVLGYPMAQH